MKKIGASRFLKKWFLLIAVFIAYSLPWDVSDYPSRHFELGWGVFSMGLFSHAGPVLFFIFLAPIALTYARLFGSKKWAALFSGLALIFVTYIALLFHYPVVFSWLPNGTYILFLSFLISFFFRCNRFSATRNKIS